MIVVADAGPLIALARVQRLALLQQLYGQIAIPSAVRDELRLADGRPGARALEQALDEGWLQALTLENRAGQAMLNQLLDAGEVEAILLAEQISCRFLLIDDRKGRAIAQQRGLPVVGVAGVLLTAKTRQLIPEIRPILLELAGIGYRLSQKLIERVVELAGEQHDD